MQLTPHCITTLLPLLLSLTHALPPQTCPPTSHASYYVCSANSFRGCCTSDPCHLTWCPDFKPGTFFATAAAAANRKPVPGSFPELVPGDGDATDSAAGGGTGLAAMVPSASSASALDSTTTGTGTTTTTMRLSVPTGAAQLDVAPGETQWLYPWVGIAGLRRPQRGGVVDAGGLAGAAKNSHDGGSADREGTGGICPAGKSWYVCADGGFRGCCSWDACLGGRGC